MIIRFQNDYDNELPVSETHSNSDIMIKEGMLFAWLMLPGATKIVYSSPGATKFKQRSYC